MENNLGRVWEKVYLCRVNLVNINQTTITVMKKIYRFLAAVVLGSMMLVSCDAEELVKDIIKENSGNVALVARQGTDYDNQYYKAGDTVKMTTVMCGSESTAKHLTIAGIRGAFNADTLAAKENFPVLVLNLMDSINGNYQGTVEIDSLDVMGSVGSWEDFATVGDDFASKYNCMVIAVDTNHFYFAYELNVDLDTVRGVGKQVEGRINSAKCKYIDVEKLEYIQELKRKAHSEDVEEMKAAIREWKTIDMDTYFPMMEFSGSFSALRADLTRLRAAISALNEE